MKRSHSYGVQNLVSHCYYRQVTPTEGNPEWGCILQPKVAVLSYLGNRGECSNPERVATFTVRKMSSGTAARAQRRMGCVICGTEP